MTLEGCYLWAFRNIGDDRRKNVWGRTEATKKVATSMWLTCYPYTGCKLKPGSRQHPGIEWKKTALEVAKAAYEKK